MVEETREEKLKRAKQNLNKKKEIAKRAGITVPNNNDKEQEQPVSTSEHITKEQALIEHEILKRKREQFNKVKIAISVNIANKDKYKDDRIAKKGLFEKKDKHERAIVITIQTIEYSVGEKLGQKEFDFVYKTMSEILSSPHTDGFIAREMSGIEWALFSSLYDRAKQNSQTQVKTPTQLNIVHKEQEWEL